MLLEKQGSSTTATYTYGNALVRKDGEYPLFDGLGSERTVTNSSQTVTGTLTLDGFGNYVASSGSSSNPYMFAATSGYRNDNDAGLCHVGARYYDAQVGRFITRDTFLDQKPYLYCEHDPVNHLDPSGHDKDTDPGGWEDFQVALQAIGGLIGAAGGTEGGLPGQIAGGSAGAVIGNRIYHWIRGQQEYLSKPGNGWGDAIPGHEHFIDPVLKGLKDAYDSIIGLLPKLW